MLRRVRRVGLGGAKSRLRRQAALSVAPASCPKWRFSRSDNPVVPGRGVEDPVSSALDAGRGQANQSLDASLPGGSTREPAAAAEHGSVVP